MKSGQCWFFGFSAVFIAAAAYVFHGTWSPDVTFVQPDCATVYESCFLLRKWTGICGGGPAVPWDLRHLLGGPYVWQELQYAVAMYLAALGAVYYLKGRGLSPVARYGAGAAYGFMGYNVTLFSAGHLGWFELLTCAPFCFGLIDRCVKKGKWRNWILLGGLLAWGGVNQPDIWLLFTVFSFAYGLFRFLRALAAAGDAAARRRTAGRVLLGVAVAASVMIAAGWPQFYRAAFVQTADRDRQIAQSTGARPDASAGDADSAAEREKRYVFCTNWSLPPDETLEFLIPGVNGGSSDPRVSPSDRYRGRIGMQASPGRWIPYRQHSLYMGFITVCLAVLGMFGVMRGRKDAAAQDAAPGADNRAEIIFWTASAGVLLLAAFGAFTPFYRLVFMLPGGDYIRCPVKFVHLLEWCVAVLAGFGAARVLSFGIARKAPAAASAALGLLLAVNMFNLAAEDSKYVAVDPADTIRIAVAKDTGCNSLAFVMDANASWKGERHVLAGGTAFRDNRRLKKALADGSCRPVSFWNLQGGGFVKVPRERAGFALLETSAPRPEPPEGPLFPCATSLVSMLASLAVCVTGATKLVRRRAR